MSARRAFSPSNSGALPGLCVAAACSHLFKTALVRKRQLHGRRFLSIMGTVMAIALCRSVAAHAQFAFVHREVVANDEKLDSGRPEAGPAGRLVSAGFAEQEHELELLKQHTPQWKHEAAPW